LNNYSIKKVGIITLITIIIVIMFFYLGVFSPLKNELENSLQGNFLNKVSINEVSIENRIERYLEGVKSLSSRTMIKNKLIDYNNQEINLQELKVYTQPKYVDGVGALENILAAYRITDNKIIAEYGNIPLDRIQDTYKNFSDEAEIIFNNDNKSVIINSPIINYNGLKIGRDIVIFNISRFMHEINQNQITYEIIKSEKPLNQPLNKGEYIFEFRRILNTDYWLKASESKTFLYKSLNSISTKILIVFIILMISILVIFYKIISNTFNNIISELKKKISKLNYTKRLLENLTNQVPGTLYQFQSKDNGEYFLPYASKGLKDIFSVSPKEVKEDIEAIYSKIHKNDIDKFINSIERSKNNLTTWHNIFRVKDAENNIRWIEGSAQPEELDSGEILWHGYIKNITERKKEKEELELQHQFQKSLAEVSSNLVNLSSYNFDYKINDSLSVIGDFFDIERIQIFKLSDDQKNFSSIHEWHQKNIASSKKELQNISTDKIPWSINQLNSKNYFTVCDIEKLPNEAKKDQSFLRSKNIKSAASVSINIDNKLYGWYAFANIKQKGICESEKIKYINIFTEVITRAIAKNLDERKIERLTYYDSLTGLYNRRFFEEEMKRLDTSRNLPFSILVADLNGLKIINDSYGHDKGDQILKKSAQILKNLLRQEDILARQGGDEFAALLPKTSREEADKIINRIKSNCEQTKDDLIPISIALGKATKERPDQNIEDLLKKADDKMYKNKLSESRSSKSNIVQGLINVLNAKSSETKEHALRMTKLAFQFGESLKLSNSEQNRLSILATLHDIGKININEEILKKKESLDNEEWSIIKKHPEYGYKIASSSEEFAAVAEDILAHHESWNGEGYPNGLIGKNIPYLARIISIVDAYDVMTNDRPYSKEISKKEALEEIKMCAGSQFDPELAQIFIEMIEAEADNLIYI